MPVVLALFPPISMHIVQAIVVGQLGYGDAGGEETAGVLDETMGNLSGVPQMG